MLMRGPLHLDLGTRWCHCCCVRPFITSMSPSTNLKLRWGTPWLTPPCGVPAHGHTFVMCRISKSAAAPRDRDAMTGSCPRNVLPSVCHVIWSLPSKYSLSRMALKGTFKSRDTRATMGCRQGGTGW
jgi:hypothetical protein